MDGCAVGLPGVLSVRPDPDYDSEEKDYSSSVQLSDLSNSQIGSRLLFPARDTKHWLVSIDKPGIGVVTKAQMVDYYAQILTKVLGKYVLLISELFVIFRLSFFFQSENFDFLAVRRMRKCAYIMSPGNPILDSAVNLMRNVHRNWLVCLSTMD